MKKAFSWILVILLVSSCGQKKAEDKTLMGFGSQYVFFPEKLNGKVKEMHETNYWAVEQDGKFTKGNPMTLKDLDSVGTLRNAIEYFDESGNLTKEESIDENNVVLVRTARTFENGKNVKVERFRADTSYVYSKPEYNAEGLLTGGKYYRTGKDTLVQTQVLSYDGNGNLTKLEYLNYKNEKAFTQELTVDEEGHVINLRFLNNRDSLSQSIEQKFDNKGFLTDQIARVVKPAQTIIWKFTPLKYDDHGNHILWLQDIDNGKFKFLTERTFIYY